MVNWPEFIFKLPNQESCSGVFIKHARRLLSLRYAALMMNVCPGCLNAWIGRYSTAESRSIISKAREEFDS